MNNPDSSKLFDLRGRVALITGGAGLLGSQHAIALAELGATVILSDINQESANSVAEAINVSMGQNLVHAVTMDVTRENDIREVLQQVNKSHGEVNVLINNAAIDAKVTAENSSLEHSRLEFFTSGEWDRQLDVGLKGAFLCSKVFGERMAANGDGVILNIASDLSVIAPDQRLYAKPGLANESQPVKPVTYSVIKHGLVGLTKYLAVYWAEHGVRVNSLSPGGVLNQQPEEFVQKVTKLIPMGRMAKKDEYRGVVQFLCSPASSYMTGQNVIVDGGRTVW